MSDEGVLGRWWRNGKDRAMATDDPLDIPMAPRDAGSILARLTALEDQMPDASGIGVRLAQLGQSITEMQGQIQWLAQQRTAGEKQLERHTRATALDLAIKAAPGVDAETLTALAAAFVAWLKAA